VVPFYDGKCADRIKQDLWAMLRKGNTYKRKDIPKDTKVILFGIGELGEICMNAYESQTGDLFRVVGCVDNNHSRWGTMFHGTFVMSADEADWKEIEYVVIATDKYYREIYLQLTKDYQVPVDKIMNYDEFIVVSQFGVEDMR
jgi:FlaA1/EpsC-like NDP-sugar epimerase